MYHVQVDDYALGRQRTNAPSGNVVEVCTEGIGNPVKGSPEQQIFNSVTVIVFYLGIFLGFVLVWIGSVLVLKWNLRDVVILSYTYSYKNYGLWWGTTCIGSIVVPVTLYSDLSATLGSYPKYGDSVRYPLCAILLGVTLLPGLIIAGYFTYKNKPAAVPYILMIPVAPCSPLLL